MLTWTLRLALLLAAAAFGCKGTVHASESESQDAGGIGSPGDPGSVDYVSGTRLRAMVYVSESGARMRYGWFDSKVGDPCRFERATDGIQRCLPFVPMLQAYGDAACTQRVLFSAGDLGSKPMFAGNWKEDSCTLSVHDLAPATKADKLYATSSSGCQDFLSLGPDGTVRAFGPPIDPSGFVGAALVREPREGQLAMQFLDADDGARQAIGTFDLLHETSCSELDPSAVVQVKEICLPRNSTIPGKFSDSSCTQPLARPPRCPLAEGDHPFALELEQKACPPRALQAVVAVGDTLSTPPYELSNGQCELSTEADAGRYARTGDAVALDSFPGIGRTHDPSGGVVVEWVVSPAGQRLKIDGFYDTKAGARCRPSMTTDCKIRCLPLAPYRYAAAMDAACTQRLVVDLEPDACAVEQPQIVLGGEAWTPCKGNVVRVFQVGQAVAAPPVVYTGSPCFGVNLSATTGYYMATEIPPSEFPEVMSATE